MALRDAGVCLYFVLSSSVVYFPTDFKLGITKVLAEGEEVDIVIC